MNAGADASLWTREAAGSPRRRRLRLLAGVTLIVPSLDLAAFPEGKPTPTPQPPSSQGTAGLFSQLLPTRAPPTPTPRPQDVQRARELLEEAVQAVGGPLVDSLVSLVVEGRRVVYTGSDSIEGQVTTYYLFPHSYRHDVRLPAGELATLVTPEGAFLLGPTGSLELPEEKRYEIEKSIARNPVALLKARRSKLFQATFTGSGKVGTEAVNLVRVEIGGEPTTVAFSSASGRILQMTYLGRGGEDDHLGEAVALFSDFRTVDGLTYPFATTGLFEGKKSVAITVEKLIVNESLPHTLFLPRPTKPSPESQPAAPRALSPLPPQERSCR
jgi:hypothetical protein